MPSRPSPALASLEASLAIRVRVGDGRIAGVDIAGERPVQAVRVLEGRSTESALAALPLMFQLCGTAQSVAGLRAIEAAFDCTPGSSGRAARSLLVALEALEQTLWRILLDWPRCSGGAADARSLKRIRERLLALRRGVSADGKWARLGGARVEVAADALRAAVEDVAADVDETVFGGSGGKGLASRPAFEEWVYGGRSAAAATLAWVYDNRFEDFGGAGGGPDGELDTEYISDRMACDDAWQYCGRPDQRGEVPQTGALARWSKAPLVRELRAEYGDGLATRLAARLVEAAALVDDLRDCVSKLAPEETNGGPAITTGRGLGVVDTSRGRLFHWVDVRDGKIARYRTLAPTQWNFHPSGTLVRGLVGARAGDPAALRQAVDLLVAAIDPCVASELEIVEAHDA
jgi:Ni,Fe-hydrogenase III large subunit